MEEIALKQRQRHEVFASCYMMQTVRETVKEGPGSRISLDSSENVRPRHCDSLESPGDVLTYCCLSGTVTSSMSAFMSPDFHYSDGRIDWFRWKICKQRTVSQLRNSKLGTF